MPRARSAFAAVLLMLALPVTAVAHSRDLTLVPTLLECERRVDTVPELSRALAIVGVGLLLERPDAPQLQDLLEFLPLRRDAQAPAFVELLSIL